MERTHDSITYLPTTETSLPSSTIVLVDSDDLEAIVGWDEESE